VSCSKALLLLMPAHAGGLPDLDARQAMTAPARGTENASPATFPMEEFLDRLMVAESGGHLRKKNPRSTALGPFQFIESTFLFIVNRHFPSQIAGLTEQQVLALRTDIAFSRQAAGAYAGDLISALEDNGLRATAANVRLAFLVGPSAAVRVLRAPPDQPLKGVLSADAIAANPFMSAATVAKLVRKAAADVSATAGTRRLAASKDREPAAGDADLRREPAGSPGDGPAAAKAGSRLELVATLVSLHGEPAATAAAWERAPPGAPAASKGEPAATAAADTPFDIKCEIGLASCRRWIAMQERKAQLVHSAERYRGGLGAGRGLGSLPPRCLNGAWHRRAPRR
jgi:hypothetical protein